MTAVDNNGFSFSRTYNLNITTAPTINLTPATLPGGTVSQAYNQTVTAGGGTAPYTFTLTGGALPNGLTLATGGLISGTPTLNGIFSFNVTATDNNGFNSTRNYTVVISSVGSLTLNPATLPSYVMLFLAFLERLTNTPFLVYLPMPILKRRTMGCMRLFTKNYTGSLPEDYFLTSPH